MPGGEVHVRLLRPLKYMGEEHGIGDDLVMPRLTADSLVRHRAAKIVAGGTQVKQMEQVEHEEQHRSTERPLESPPPPRPSSSTPAKKKPVKRKTPAKKKG